MRPTDYGPTRHLLDFRMFAILLYGHGAPLLQVLYPLSLPDSETLRLGDCLSYRASALRMQWESHCANPQYTRCSPANKAEG